jgi:isocitrate/isopropylmalate dehydrogenase
MPLNKPLDAAMITPSAASPRALEIVLIQGDGIGPEIVRSAVEVMTAACAADGLELVLTDEPAGAGHYRDTGAALSPGALERLRAAAGVLKGPVGLPEVRLPDGTEGGLLGGALRIGLDTYANIRPIRLMPGVEGATRARAGEIDYVIVRENTEGLYLSRGNGVANYHAACDQLLITRAGTERVVRAAFELAVTRSGAPADGVSRVTCVDKSNVLRSYAFFRQVFDEVSAEYPGVEAERRYADSTAQMLVTDPQHFDVLVMENMLGDILSDLGGGTIGGLGMCPSGNIGDHAAYFEPIHGSAPAIAGRDLANPVSQILSAAMLLRHAGQPRSADRINAAVEAAFAEGACAVDRIGVATTGTRAVTHAIINRIPSGD